MAIPHNFNPIGLDTNTLDVVRDGLLVWLDGRDAPAGDYWMDRSGNLNNAKSYGAVYQPASKGYYFTSTSNSQNTYCMTDAIIPIAGDAACTVEAVATMLGSPKYGGTLTSNAVLYLGGNAINLDDSTGNYFRLGIRTATGVPAYTSFFGTAGVSVGTVTEKQILYNEKQFFSFAKSPGAFTASQPTAGVTACVGGQFYTPTANGTGTFAITANKLHVGRLAQQSGIVRAMEGIVHSVRIYNRKLTGAEQLQNYLYDITNH